MLWIQVYNALFLLVVDFQLGNGVTFFPNDRSCQEGLGLESTVASIDFRKRHVLPLQPCSHENGTR